LSDLLIRDDTTRFTALVSATANNIDLDPALVEKDYWVVEALRSKSSPLSMTLRGDQFEITPIFKGGTSLSKAFGLIERFSEDIDLLIPIPVSAPMDLSNQERSHIMDSVRRHLSTALRIEGERKGGRRGVDFHWNFPFESYFAVSPSTTMPVVVVKMTVMGGSTPNLHKPVSSMVGDFAKNFEGLPHYADLTPVTNVCALSPLRTLVEKLAMLHNAATLFQNGDPRRLSRSGRHYYDVLCLLRSPLVRQEVSAEVVHQIAVDSDNWSALGNYPVTPRPNEGFAVSPAFTDSEILGLVESSYQLAMTWVWGEKPSLKECVATVVEAAEWL